MVVLCSRLSWAGGFNFPVEDQPDNFMENDKRLGTEAEALYQC